MASWCDIIASMVGHMGGAFGDRGRVNRLRTLDKPSKVKCQKSENSLGECLFLCLCVCGVCVWYMVYGCLVDGVRVYGCRLSRCLFFFFGDPISSGPLFIYCRTATAAAAPSSCCHNKKAQPQSEIYINIQVYTIYTHNYC